jgi:DNA-binding CsgD family transcriptional regulator
MTDERSRRPCASREEPRARAPDFSPPAGLSAWRLDIEGSEFALLALSEGATAPGSALLTKAETDVARRMIAGLSNAEIARHRHTSCRTVANQAASIFKKLHVQSRYEAAVAFAMVSPVAGQNRRAQR